jgi:hypothetical protein
MFTSPSQDRLYFAVLHAAVSGAGHRPGDEKSFVLLRADSEQRARDVATAIGQCEEHSYRNEYGELVRRSYLQVATIYEVWPWSPEHPEDLPDE